MPQVDKVTFFPQVVWLIALLIVFYIFFLRNIFVKICNTQTTRVQFYLANFTNAKMNQIQRMIKNLEIFSTNDTVLAINVLENKINLIMISNIWFQECLERRYAAMDLFQELHSKEMEQYLEEKVFVETSF